VGIVNSEVKNDSLSEFVRFPYVKMFSMVINIAGVNKVIFLSSKPLFLVSVILNKYL
jgi:hypothetical protein